MPKMTIDECLEFADEWSRGMTFHEGSQGWRVVCMLLAAEVRNNRAMFMRAGIYKGGNDICAHLDSAIRGGVSDETLGALAREELAKRRGIDVAAACAAHAQMLDAAKKFWESVGPPAATGG